MSDQAANSVSRRKTRKRWALAAIVWLMVPLVLGFLPITYFGIRQLEAIGTKRDQAVTLLRARRAVILEIVRASERDPTLPLTDATADMIETMVADINAVGESEDGQRAVMDRVTMAVESARTNPRGPALGVVVPPLDVLYVRDQEIVDAFRDQFARIGIQGPRSLLILEVIAGVGLATAATLVTLELRRRDRVERQLRASRERLADAERMARLGHWDVNFQTKRAELSDSLHEIVGIPRKFFGGTLDEAFTIVHPEDRERVRDSMLAIIERPLPLFDQFRFVVNGATRIMFIQGTPAKDDEGKVVRVSGTAQDITDQVKAEHAIRQSEARFKSLCDYAPLVIFQSRADGWNTYISPRWEEISGKSPQTSLGWGWTELIHPDDRKRVTESWASAVENGEPWTHEYRIIRPDKAERWLRVLACPIRDDAGAITGFIGTAEDITRRVGAERHAIASRARFDAVIRASRQIVYDWNPATDDLDIDGASEDVIGLTAIHLRTFGGWVDRVHPDDRATFDAEVERVLKTREPFSLEYRMLRADGVYIPVHDRGYFILGPEGHTRMIGLVADLSDRKSLEAQLIQSQKMESIGRLAGGIAHDFNNWLTAIIGHARVAREIAIAPGVAESIDQILLAANFATGLTHQLLAFARKQVIDPRVCNPADVVEHARKLLAQPIGEHIKLTVKAAPNLWNIRIDPAQIQQVLVNLAINARDAMPGGGRLTIELSNVTIDAEAARLVSDLEPGEFVQITVADTGQGITPEVLPQIFEPFFTTKEQGKGTGLGLPTVMGIVKQSDGHIGVTSSPGRGTTFTLHFPRVKEPALLPMLPVTAPGPVPSTDPTPSARPGETILLVEDQAIIRGMVQGVLDRRGYTVLAAGDAPEAVDIAASHPGPIHLLLTDLVLPSMNGKALAAQIADARPDIRVLLTSGYTDEPEGLDPGSNFIQKPYSPEQILRLVRQMLDRSPPAPPPPPAP